MVTMMKRLRSDERGQALPLALITLALGSLLIGGFLSHASTNLIAVRVFERSMPGDYAADAGVEDAIWNLVYGDLATTVLINPGDSASYSPTETVNELTPAITVTKSQSDLAGGQSTIASDDFESGKWSGGSGWLNAWNHTGTCQVIKKESPYEGSYHLEMTKHNSYVARSADLSGYSGLHLQFWAKVRSFEAGDEMYCLVSHDGSHWTTAKTWTSADSDNTYHFNDIDLSPYTHRKSKKMAASSIS